MIDKAKIADAEQQAAMATMQRDLAIAQNQVRQLTDKCNSLEKDNDDLSESLRKKAKREGESSLLMERLTNLRSEARELERSRDEASNQLAGLQAELDQYKKIAQANEPEVTPEQYEALEQELAEYKEHSRRQLQELQEQLDSLSKKSDNPTRQSGDSDSVLEFEVLRQEHDMLSHSLEDRQSELQASQQTCQLLEDELEDAHTSIDEMRRQLEKQEEELKKFKNEAAKQEHESVSEMLAESIQQEQEFEKSVPVLGINSAGKMQKKQKVISMLSGAAILFVVLEAVSIVAGPGELLGNLFRSETSPTASSSSTDDKTSSQASQTSTKPGSSGQIIRK